MVEALANRAIEALSSRRARGRIPLSERFVLDIMDAAREDEEAMLIAAIDRLMHTGVPVEEVLDFYIPEAARRLGDAWCEDGMGFAGVTISVARLQRRLRELCIAPRDGGPSKGGSGPSVLLVVPSDDYHTLGAMVVTEQFRRAGISVRLKLGEDHHEILRSVAAGQFDAIFFSVAVSEKLAHLRELTDRIRRSARQPVAIVVGGAAVNGGIDAKSLTGADYATSDPKEALRLCGLTTSPLGGSLTANSG